MLDPRRKLLYKVVDYGYHSILKAHLLDSQLAETKSE